MMMMITLGWWIIPLAITAAALAWALPMRSSEKGDGSMFGTIHYAVAASFRTLIAMIISLGAWLIWSLLN